MAILSPDSADSFLSVLSRFGADGLVHLERLEARATSTGRLDRPLDPAMARRLD